jgi:hypothetical protein
MNWDAISAAAEVVAGIAVVISLIYVAAQIRLNTQELRAASFREVYTGYSRLRLSSVENPAISELHCKALENPGEMSVQEKYRIEQFYAELAWVTHQLYATIALNMIEPRTWEISKYFLAEHLRTEPGRLWWQKSAGLFDDNFVAEITNTIENTT